MAPADEIDETFAAVDAALARFLADQSRRLAPLGPELAHLVTTAADFVSGGKRLRPSFCVAGWRVATGASPHDPVPDEVTTAAAALEWLQASALVHDDLMDGSDTRRGRPSVHRAYAALHRAEARTGDADGFGASAAVLIGDLMLSWCDEMLRRAGRVGGPFADGPGAARLAAAFAILDECKTEVVAGQFLDVASQTRAEVSAHDAMLVARYKSAKYTVERPLHLGARLGGGDDALLAALSAVALPLGEAFQLRDDVLGVFGDPRVTGKPAGDDLREGKRTLLVARAAELGGPTAADLLRTGLGTAEAVTTLRELIVSTGALAAVESDITRLVDEARSALADLPDVARSVLEPLVTRATQRNR